MYKELSKNQPIVQKYGGTSVGTVERIKAIASRVSFNTIQATKIAIVVSAMSGETNRLVGLVMILTQMCLNTMIWPYQQESRFP